MPGDTPAGDGYVASPLLELGAVIGAHGLAGLLRVKLFTPDAGGIAAAGSVILAPPAGTEREARVTHLAPGPRGQVILGLAGVGSRDAAEALRGALLRVRREALPDLEDDEFYLADAVGCAAVTPEGAPLGTVVAVGDNGAQPLLVIEDGDERFHVPALAPFVQRFGEGRVVLALPDGLREAVSERLRAPAEPEGAEEP